MNKLLSDDREMILIGGLLGLLISGMVGYISFQVSVGIWVPNRATKRQLIMVGHPAVQVMQEFLKWFAPFLTVVIVLSIMNGLLVTANYFSNV